MIEISNKLKRESARLQMGIMAHLEEDAQENVHVVATNSDGVDVSLGFISSDLVNQNPAAALLAVKRIQFHSLMDRNI